MRAVWNGYISLGHVGFPVQLYGASKPGRLHLTQLDKVTLNPIELMPVRRTDKKPISSKDIVKGAKQPSGEYITLSDQDLARTSEVGGKAIAIQQFTNLSDIDPIYYSTPYYIVPNKGGERAYTLIREVLARTKKVAIGKFMMHAKEHIAAIRAYDSILLLHQLRFTQELVPRSEIKTPPLEKPTLPELDMGTELINRLTGPFFAEDFRDEQADRLSEIVDRKSKGLPIGKKVEKNQPMTDDDELLNDLRRSLDEPPAIDI